MAIKSKKQKLGARERTKFRIRKRIVGTKDQPRLSVFRSNVHTSAQVISDLTGETLASASTREAEVMSEMEKVLAEFNAAHQGGEEGGSTSSLSINSARSTKSVAAALAVGSVLAQRLQAKNISSVVFDRNGYVYQGRVQAVAEAARLKGLQF